MSQYLSEDPEVQVDHVNAFDAAQVEDTITTRLANDDLIANTNIDQTQSAASYLGNDVDEYGTALQTAPTQIEQYLELGVDQDPATAVSGQTFNDQIEAQNTMAENAAADQAALATATAESAAEAAAATPSVVLPAQTEDQARSDALRGMLLYENGSFANGAIGGINNQAAINQQNAAIREGIYPIEESTVEPADPVDATPPVEGQGGQKQSEDAVDSFNDHLHRKPKR